MSRVLVVGGAGFIGSHLMKRRPDWEVLDLKNGDDFRDGVGGDYDVIILLAAWLGQEEDDYIHNLAIYNALAESYDRKEKPFIVYTSSAAVYADSNEQHDEIEEPDPSTLYGKSKLLGENIIRTLFPSTTLRLGNVFGDGDGNGVIDLFKQGVRTVYGDGKQVRDYIYVGRVVDAIIHAAEHEPHYVGHIYNISSGEGLTVNQVFEKHAKGKPLYEDARDFDVGYSVLNNAAAKDDGLL